MINTDLTPYAGPWTFAQAAHLLRRTTFGPTYAQIKWAEANGLQATLDQLFGELPVPDPPVNAFYPDDVNVPIGQPWVGAPYEGDFGAISSYRFRSVTGWTLGLIWEEGISIREKLTLFWHNHLPISVIEDPKLIYRYGKTLRDYAWGNFRQLIKDITIDPAMLRFLNGSQNKKEAPNENYARELLELFTIGKGPQIGPGDYANYTEQDVKEIARALSGWRDFGLNVESNAFNGNFGSEFVPDRHDDGVKTLSYHFDNAVIPNMWEDEYGQVVDIIFQQDEVARFICRKLYRWFVFSEIDAAIETNIIQPMAQILIDQNFEIRPAVEALLGSEHFFDEAYTGVIIKNPIDFMMSILKTLDVDVSAPLDQRYDSWYRIWGLAGQQQMRYYEAPEVAGWQAYYREPLWYRNWLNASTLRIRMKDAETLATNGYFPFQANGEIMRVEVLKLLATLDNPDDPGLLVDECVKILFPKPISPERKEALKSILLGGLPDSVWTQEYIAYVLNPGNSTFANAVDNRLRPLIKAMLTMPDFFLH